MITVKLWLTTSGEELEKEEWTTMRESVGYNRASNGADRRAWFFGMDFTVHVGLFDSTISIPPLSMGGKAGR